MENKNIFLYWVGKEYKLISILRKLIYLHSVNYKVHLLTDKNLNEYVKDIPECFDKLCAAHQADFIRVNVICDYGGIWLDSDTLVLESLDTICNGFFIKEDPNSLCNGIFGSKPNTPLMIKWKNSISEVLKNNKNGVINWTQIGGDILNTLYKTNPELYDDYVIYNGMDNVYPVNWKYCVDQYIVKPYDNYKTIIRGYQPFIVLVNSVYRSLENKTEREILEGNIPLNYFLNKSIENKGIIKSELYTSQYIYNYGKSDYISNSIIQYKCWEPNISNIFDNLTCDSVILDIGCNIGYYSILCANNKCISKIYSVDANIHNINMLNMSCSLNGIYNIQTINKCISDEPLQYYQPSNEKLILKVGNIGGLSYSKTTDEGVVSTTIDELITLHTIQSVSIMKIDIEGGELNALKGASNTLKTNTIKNIIIEISPKFNNDSNQILQILKDNNYDIYNIPHQETGIYNSDSNFLKKIKQPIHNIDTFIKNIGCQTNILAVKIIKYVIYTEWIKTYLTKEHFIFVKNLELYGWEIIELSKLNVDIIKRNKCIVLCVTYDDFDVSLIKCENVQIIYKIDDLYPFKDIRNKCIENSDTIISPYQYLFTTDEIKKMYKITCKNIFLPYSAVNEYFNNVPFNTNPIYKIFVSGFVDSRYPFRNFIKTNITFKKYIEFLDHPSYTSYTHNCINEEYYKKLNEYVCCFVDAMIYKYILLKVFEIPSVGSLLLIDDSISDELNTLGFYDTINCIFCNVYNVENKIKWILDIKNKDIIDTIRKTGMEIVRNIHSTKNRSEHFNTILHRKIL